MLPFFINIRAKQGNSIIEVMIAILVVTVGVMGAYEIAFQGNALAVTTENRIKAINIAREGLEIVENIRDTNWIKLSSDLKACYDVLDYDVSCIGSGTGVVPTIKRMYPGSYIPSQTSDGAWTLTLVNNPSPIRAVYLTQFPVHLDENGLVIQNGAYAANCSTTITKNCNTRFSRELIITRPTDYSTINIESVVTWTEPGKETPYEIRIPYTLYNWKYEFYKD